MTQDLAAPEHARVVAEPVGARREAVRQRSRARRRHRALVIALRLLILLMAIGAWEVIARTQGSPLTSPTASAVAAAWLHLIFRAELWQAVAVTMQAFVLGFGLALVSGVAIGLVTGRFETLRRLSAVHLRILMTAPLAPLVPLMMGIFGIGLATRVALVYVFCIAVMAINTQVGVRHVDPSLIEMARSIGAKELMVFRKVRLPAALPAVMAGVRLGAARAIIGMVVAEFIIVSVGLGQLVKLYRGQFQTAEMFAVVLVILMLGLTILYSIKLVEKRLTSWKR